MAPNIDPASDQYLTQRYDELYNGSDEFKSRLHNIVATPRALTLALNAANGTAGYTMQTNTITVYRRCSDGSRDKTDTEVRDDLFFELHNAKKAMNFNEIYGPKGYNKGMLSGDIKKAAGYAIAMEWTEWINVVESTLLAYFVNTQARVDLLPSPPAFWSTFENRPAATSWRKFSNYLSEQVETKHTRTYDKAATGAGWKGFAYLKAVTGASLDSTPFEISSTEINSSRQGGNLYLKSRSNPFKWELFQKVQVN